MNITGHDLLAERHRLGHDGQQHMRDAIAYTRAEHVTLDLLQALSSREAGMENIIGDGGHGRGRFQLDDRFQQVFLHAHAGCRPGTDVPRWAEALTKGRVPTTFAGGVQTCRILEHNIVEAARSGVPFGHRRAVAIAGFNQGLAGAINAWHAHGDPDVGTTGGDYSRDVLERLAYLQAH